MANLVIALDRTDSEAISWLGWGATLAIGASLWAGVFWMIVR